MANFERLLRRRAENFEPGAFAGAIFASLTARTFSGQACRRRFGNRPGCAGECPRTSRRRFHEFANRERRLLLLAAVPRGELSPQSLEEFPANRGKIESRSSKSSERMNDSRNTAKRDSGGLPQAAKSAADSTGSKSSARAPLPAFPSPNSRAHKAPGVPPMLGGFLDSPSLGGVGVYRLFRGTSRQTEATRQRDKLSKSLRFDAFRNSKTAPCLGE